MQYDSEDQATTLALGTLMLRKSRAKILADASYNRFAWNDPNDLPEWFVDDEVRHYRPQLPIPKALMDSIKQRFQDLTSKPIKKVAEARARKRKRAADKLRAAKKKAEALSNADGMSEKEKLKAISQVPPPPLNLTFFFFSTLPFVFWVLHGKYTPAFFR